MGGDSSTTTTSLVGTAIDDVSFSGITGELTGVLPIILPVAITMLALRKGISFMFSVLRGA